MKTILLMDIVIVFVGIYLAVSAAKMKKSGQISDLVVPKEEIKKCKDPEAYIRGITPWLYGFAAVAVVVGAIGILCDSMYFFPFPHTALREKFVFHFTHSAYKCKQCCQKCSTKEKVAGCGIA